MPDDRDNVASASGRSLRGFGRRAGAQAFVRWWLGELALLVPRRARSAITRRRLRPVLLFDADAATLWLPASRDGAPVMESSASIPLADAAASAQAGRAAIESLARGAAYGGTAADPRVLIALPGRQVLRRTLTLPAALEENLRQALGYDLDRHTPFKADELYFDAAIIGRDGATDEIRVDLAAARRGIVDQALQRAESWGAYVAAVVPDLPAAMANSRLNLLPEERRPVQASWRRPQFWLPAALVAILAVVAIGLPVWQKREYAIELNRLADEARAQAAVSERLRAELDGLAADYNFALQRKFAFPSSLQMLDEVTKLLPDDTWLTQLEMKTSTRGKDVQRELLMRGESGNAGRLIAAFEESKVFTQAAPRSPTTKFQPGPGEIFDLTAQLRALPPPAAVKLVATAAADVPAGTPPPGTAPTKGTAGALPTLAPTNPRPEAPPPAAPGAVPPAGPAVSTPQRPVAPGATPGGQAQDAPRAPATKGPP